jgi:alpha-tubulin suppressor-like RCC1 family protein
VDVVDVRVGCASDADCASDPAGRVCNLLTSRCVQCVTTNDTCPAAQHCDSATNTCVAGCRSDEGCVGATRDGGVATIYCDPSLNACVPCVLDTHCPSGSVCRGNVCATGCAATGCSNAEMCCEGGCVDFRTNVAHCGACGAACNLPNATPACRGGACAIAACDEGYGDCDGAAANGCEFDTRSDPANCGGCARTCPSVPNATPTCGASRCGYACVAGFGDCDGDAANGCETDLRADVTNCGACRNRCPFPANGGPACAGGVCGVGTCGSGFGDCDRNAGNGCETDTNTSFANCGTCGRACSMGLVCEAGGCVVPCPRGFVTCAGECVSLRTDTENCGTCGNRCATGTYCSSGSCVSTCSTGQVICAGSCSNPQTDSENCGTCGNRCAAGNTCMAGVCRVACVVGQTICGTACADTLTSNLHCGACNNPCGPGEQCMSGVCRLTCRAPQVVCGAECAELSRDPNNCGSCGHVCPTGCFGGACARVDTLEAGTYNNCARYTSGRVFCWGLHSPNSTFAQGMLTAAGGMYGHRATPVQLLDPAGVPLEGVEQVVMGTNRACGRLTDGSVRCWASGVAMGAVPGLPAVTQLTARETNFCGLGNDGRVYCWDGLPRAVTAPALSPVVTLASVPVEVRAGGTFTCARFADRTVQCWGTGTSGQLGNGASVSSATTPVTVRGLTDAEELATGRDFACARRTGGTIVCWGANSDGQLGDASVTNRNAPVAVVGVVNAATLRAGLRHACVISTDGSVRCWGDNQWSQLGDGTTADRNTSVAVPGLTVQQIRLTAYDHHTCVVGVDRRVFCWGYNPFGEAGGGTESVATPQAVQFNGADLAGITQLEVGQAVNSALMATAQWRCALHSDGRVFCWGNRGNGNEAGQLGRGNTTQSPLPLPVTGLTDATQIAVGWIHACALKRDGTVVCWGSNAQGQLGDGTNTNRSLPVAVTGLTGVVEIKSGDYTTCARLSSGAVRCWGYNFYGELGNATMINSNAPVPVMAITSAARIEMGANYACALLTNGEAWCWGRNIESQLGDGFRTNRSVPYPVQASTATASVPVSQTGLADLRADYYRSYSHLASGAALGWGWTFPNRASAQPALNQVSYNTRVYVFGEPIDNECELRNDGGTWCRGRNEFGQIGDGTTSFAVTTFTLISSQFSAIRLGRGYGTPCAVERTTGRVLCWGWTGNGALLSANITGITTRPSEIVQP